MLAKLRWFIFSKYQYNSENLPSTFGGLKYKILSLRYFNFETCCCIKTKFNIIFKLWLGNCGEQYYANIDRQFTGTVSSNRIKCVRL